MRNPALFSRIFNTPLMIQASKLDAIVAGIGSRWGLDETPQNPALWALYKSNNGEAGQIGLLKPGMAITSFADDALYGRTTLHGDVAVIDVIGVLAHRGGFDANSSYILGYDTIGKSINVALADRKVESILLQIDSPGGEVAGAHELAAQIREASQIKPVKAVVSSMAASAGYLIASAANEIAISETGIAGSIGVVMKHIDISKMAEKDGIAVTYIYAGDHKIDGNPFGPLPDAVKADLQDNINKLYGLFVQTVGGYRNLSTEAIRAQQAQVYTGQDAIKQGLADRIATPDEILAEMQAKSTTTTQRRSTMSTKDNDAALEQQALDKARADGFEAGKLEGAKLERDRINAVMTSEHYAGREAMAAKMLENPALTAEAINGILATAPKAAAPAPQSQGQSEFERAMAKEVGVTNIGAGAINLGKPDGEETDEQLAANVVALHQKLNGGRK